MRRAALAGSATILQYVRGEGGGRPAVYVACDAYSSGIVGEIESAADVAAAVAAAIAMQRKDHC